MNRRLALAASVLVAAPMCGRFDLASVEARAEAPATQPAVDPADAIIPSMDQADPTLSPPGQPAGPGPGENRRPRGARGFQPLTDKEIADAMQWMSQHSKNRFDAIQSLPDGERKTEIKAFTTRAYLNWMRLAGEKENDLYFVVIKRVELEDVIFGKVTLLKKETNPDKKKMMTDDLKTDVGKLLDIGLKERKLRLDRLSELVKKEQKKLDEDTTNRAALVDERLNAILKSGDNSSLVPNGGGGDSGGGTGTGQRGRGAPRQ